MINGVQMFRGLSSFAVFASLTRAIAEVQDYFAALHVSPFIPILFTTGAPRGVQLIID
jgi:hypothetical protein